MAVPNPLLTDFGIYHELESCDTQNQSCIQRFNSYYLFDACCAFLVIYFSITPMILFFREKAKNRLAAAYELEKNRDTVLKDIADLVPSSVQDTGTHTISVTHIDSLSKLNSDQVKDTKTTFLSALWTKRSRNSC